MPSVQCTVPSLQLPNPSLQFPVSSAQSPVPSSHFQCPVSGVQYAVSSFEFSVSRSQFPASGFHIPGLHSLRPRHRTPNSERPSESEGRFAQLATATQNTELRETMRERREVCTACDRDLELRTQSDQGRANTVSSFQSPVPGIQFLVPSLQ